MSGTRPPPVHYEIRIEGILGEHWAAWFEDLQVGSEAGETILSGPVSGQPALHGVLVKIRDLGMCLISVRRLAQAKPETRPGRKPPMRQIHVAKRLPKAGSLPQTPLPPDPRDMDASARLWLAQPTAREARSEAVFASTLQPSDTPTADMIASAISCALQRLGTRGCAEKMAQEFGDHPDVAAERMRWARQLAA